MNLEPNSAQPLTPRQREVLGAIVEQYIQRGVPISSRMVAKMNSEGLSSATIRSIMADLEEAGFITHTHTSSGRVPTDQGYRYYVDCIGQRTAISKTERETLAETLYATGGLDSLIARCCRLLSAATNEIGIATAPDHDRMTYRHVEFVRLSGERVLAVFISGTGVVHQQVVGMKSSDNQAELNRFASYLNTELEGRTLLQVRDRIAQLMRDERSRYDELARHALRLGGSFFAGSPGFEDELVVDGTERFLERDDLAGFDQMKELITALEEKSRILHVLNDCLDRGGGVTTAIGTESHAPELANCSLVAASYGPEDQPVGALGVIGPTRMEYHRTMAIVSYVAELLGTALNSSR